MKINKKIFTIIIAFSLFSKLFGMPREYPGFRSALELLNEERLIDQVLLLDSIYDEVLQEEINLNRNGQRVLPEYGIGNFNLALNTIRLLYELNSHNNAGIIVYRLENYQRGTELNLSGLNIDSNTLTLLIPYINNLVDCLNLRRLNLSNNILTFLPRTFGDLNGLFSLDLSGNQISYFHESFNVVGGDDTLDCLQHITSLKILNLSKNVLSYLPWQLSKLLNLRLLDISSNRRLRVLPNFFSRLFNLDYLDLWNTSVGIQYSNYLQRNIDNLNIYF